MPQKHEEGVVAFEFPFTLPEDPGESCHAIMTKNATRGTGSVDNFVAGSVKPPSPILDKASCLKTLRTLRSLAGDAKVREGNSSHSDDDIMHPTHLRLFEARRRPATIGS